LSLFLHLPVCRRSWLLTGGRRGRGESLALSKSFETLRHWTIRIHSCICLRLPEYTLRASNLKKKISAEIWQHINILFLPCVAVTSPCDPKRYLKANSCPWGIDVSGTGSSTLDPGRKANVMCFLRPGPTLWESAPRTWSTWLRLAKTAGRSAQPTSTASVAGTNNSMLTSIYFFSSMYNIVRWFWHFWEIGECWPDIMAANLNSWKHI
jgi:hypothetical protein